MSQVSTDLAVVDTMVASWLRDERPNLQADLYREVIGDRQTLLAFQTVAELRYGALHAGWVDLRRRSLDRQIAESSGQPFRALAANDTVSVSAVDI